MSKQFEITRAVLMGFLNDLDEKIIDVQPQGFNNTIRWHIGHVLVAAEKFIFGYPEQSKNLPEAYLDMFDTGTKPADWNSTDIPSLNELKSHLEKQTPRINELSKEFLAEKLPFEFPIFNIQTYGELYALMLYHEADHLGQMKAIKRIATA